MMKTGRRSKSSNVNRAAGGNAAGPNSNLDEPTDTVDDGAPVDQVMPLASDEIDQETRSEMSKILNDAQHLHRHAAALRRMTVLYKNSVMFFHFCVLFA